MFENKGWNWYTSDVFDKWASKQFWRACLPDIFPFLGGPYVGEWRIFVLEWVPGR